MQYIIGDIHGCMDRLFLLYERISRRRREGDELIFLGDYIDRGSSSFEVIEFLLSIRDEATHFLMGNHEKMLLDYIDGNVDYELYSYNGGDATLASYKRNRGTLVMPDSHAGFFNGLERYYEGNNFIAVHAGLAPFTGRIELQSEHDLIWIREGFFKADYHWDKTVIFGHTPTFYLHGRMGEIYLDSGRNIIGIDTGAVYGGRLTCLVWPDFDLIQI